MLFIYTTIYDDSRADMLMRSSSGRGNKIIASAGLLRKICIPFFKRKQRAQTFLNIVL